MMMITSYFINSLTVSCESIVYILKKPDRPNEEAEKHIIYLLNKVAAFNAEENQAFVKLFSNFGKDFKEILLNGLSRAADQRSENLSNLLKPYMTSTQENIQPKQYTTPIQESIKPHKKTSATDKTILTGYPPFPISTAAFPVNNNFNPENSILLTRKKSK